MIHLEEYTYIDTSLITCAEYQLFLDQQRSYGHFLQPDHWETTSFPQGQGLAPVLGVRSSEALTFCAWLTERDPGIWQYRLPTLDEQKRLEADKSLMISTQESLGYWVENGRAFAWIRNVPPPTDSIMNMTYKVFNRNSVTIRSHALSVVCNRTRVLDLEHIWNRIAALKFNGILDPTLSHAHILMEARYANHTHTRRLVEDITRDRDSLHILTEIFEQEVTRVLNRASRHTTIDHALDCSCKLANMFNQVQKPDLWGNQALIDAYECCLDLVVSLVLLKARMRNELPAREGILLARERVR